MEEGSLGSGTGLCTACQRPLTGSGGPKCVECVFDELTGFSLVQESPVLDEVTDRLRLGPYALLEVIGRGGMGVVYRARETTLGREVALKTISGIFLPGEPATLRFKQEAASTARLNHPNIVPVFEFGEIDSQLYFTMQLIEGATSADKVAEGNGRDPRWCARIVAEVAEAISYAHQRGVLHRDIKPANILIDSSGKPWVTDFGLAKLIEGDQSCTQSGAHLGTPAYMAPEQCDGPASQVTTLADVYALGALLYHMLTGHPPFEGSNPVDTMRRVVDHDLRPPRRIDPKIPRDLEAICLKCMEKSVIRRYSTALALREEIGAWLEDRPVQARRQGIGYRVAKWCRRRPMAAGFVGLAVAFLILAGFLAVERGARGRERHQRQILKQLYYATDMLLASRAIEAGNLDLAASRLNDHVPAEGEEDLRGFEWYAFQKALRGDQIQTLTSPSVGPVDRLAIADDARSLVAAGRDFIWRWDLSTDPPQERLFWAPGRPGGPGTSGIQFSNLELSADGRVLMAACGEGVWLWDVPGATPVAVPAEAMAPAALHPGGTRFAARWKTGGWKLWNTAENKAEWDRDETVLGLDISGNGKRLVYHGPDAPVIIDLMDGKLVRAMKSSPEGELCGVLLSETGEYLVSRYRGKLDRVQFLALRRPLPVVLQRSVARTGFAVKERPATLFMTDARPPLTQMVDPENGGRELLHGHSRGIRCLAQTGDGNRLATASDDGTIRIWDARQQAVAERSLGTGIPHGSVLTIAPDGKKMAVGTMLLDLESTPSPARDGSAPRIVHPWVGFQPDFREFFAVEPGADGQSCLVRAGGSVTNLAGGPRFDEHRRWICSPDGRWLAGVQADGSGALWSTADGRRLRTWAGQSTAGSAGALSPSGRWLALGSPSGLTILDLTAGPGSNARHLGLTEECSFVAFSPDSRNVVVCEQRSAGWHLWNFETSSVSERYSGHLDPVITARFSPDGRSVITAGEDGSIKLWNLRTGREVAAKGVRRQEIPVDATFAPDASFTAWLTEAGTLQIWRR